ncbi:hypothetical protein BD626DRAFT_173896 [Schizophyllum amplum]|uniref:Uncharacterized protein n=1 Tax=Schizophyllum amplum TaxID=97359 RepID=A0A550C2F4_9AGAR|nr:hypothetical protein BD626DRAFT_173896 [Auriculariopsis ampla]
MYKANSQRRRSASHIHGPRAAQRGPRSDITCSSQPPPNRVIGSARPGDAVSEPEKSEQKQGQKSHTDKGDVRSKATLPAE